MFFLEKENNYFKVMKIKIRNAVKEDMKQVHDLIVELLSLIHI